LYKREAHHASTVAVVHVVVRRHEPRGSERFGTSFGVDPPSDGQFFVIFHTWRGNMSLKFNGKKTFSDKPQCFPLVFGLADFSLGSWISWNHWIQILVSGAASTTNTVYLAVESYQTLVKFIRSGTKRFIENGTRMIMLTEALFSNLQRNCWFDTAKW
jgi:hypothetical protein